MNDYQSPVGWWFGSALFRDDNSTKYWNNSYLIKAFNLRTAYKKLSGQAKREERVSKEAFDNGMLFLGVTNLVPIYEIPGDCSELLWEEFIFDSDNSEQLPMDVYTLEEIANM
ncbi:MAG: hypothetical protein EAZ42_12240 [Verrucomicrobia bacterium]|nr:MAG: hypothetical protein EAZ42_12240 [Verrucomicrobiota bacterium]